MCVQINQILDSEILLNVLKTLFVSKPVTILKAIARTGVKSTGVPWVHIRNDNTGKCIATFLSFEDILNSFFEWLETAEIMLLSMFQVKLVGEVVWQCVEEGDRVWAKTMGWVEVLEKDRTESLDTARFWVDYAGSLAQIPASSIGMIDKNFVFN